MAGDGRGCIADRISAASIVKIRRLGDGSLLGTCGSQADLALAAEWLSRSDGKKPKLQSDFDGLRLMPDGSLIHFVDDLEPCVIDAPFAIGSGADFAIGAMDEGADAETAVKRAMSRDPFTGGKITVLRLKQALQVAS